MGFDGKVAIVTGAGRGIGLAYAQSLARQGVSVVIAEQDKATGCAAEEVVRAEGSDALFVETDVSDPVATKDMVATTVRTFGGLDYLVNNAAIWGALRPAPPEDITFEEWQRVVAVNYTGVWLCSQAAIPALKNRGGGAIVNQSSIGAYWGGANTVHYNSTKAAVNGLTRSLAHALGPFGIRVNSIAPGIVTTEATNQLLSPERLSGMLALQPLSRPGDTDDITGPLLFLLSEEAKFITGQVLVVDGGLVMLG